MKSFQIFFKTLDAKDKSKISLVLFIIILVALFELLGIAAVIPFITLLIAPEKLNNFAILQNFFNFQLYSYADQILYCIIFFISVFIIKNFMIIVFNKYIFNFIFKYRAKIYKKLLDNYIHQKFSFFLSKPFYQIINNLNFESDKVAQNYLRPLLYVISESIILISIIFLSVFLFGYFKILIVIIFLVLLISFFLKKVNNIVKNNSTKRIEYNENIIKISQDFINGIKEIILQSNPYKVLNNLNFSQKRLSEIDTKLNVLRAFPKGILEVFAVIVLTMTIFTFIKMGFDSDKVLIILSFYLAAAYRILPSLNIIFINYQNLKSGEASLKKIFNDLTMSKKITYYDDNSIIFKKNILIKNVSFAYKDQKILSNLDFELSKGDFIGIYGESGSGKTTFLNILLGLLEPNHGEIFLDGNKLLSFESIRSYQNIISYASQDSYLINGTIEDNINLYSNEEINLERLENAIKAAELHSFIDNLENKAKTNINSLLRNLSSGQKQRLILARLFYNIRDLVILDEATNALDEEVEKKIMHNIKKLNFEGKTIVMVSHNLQNLDFCNKIYQFKDKKLNISK